MERVRDGIAGLDAHHRRALRRAAAEVERRTGCTVWFNRKFGSLQCSDGDNPEVLYDTMDNQVVGPGGSVRVPDPGAMVREIQRSRWMTLEAKKAELAKRQKADGEAMERAQQKMADDITPEFKSRYKHNLNRIRHGEHSRPSVLT